MGWGSWFNGIWDTIKSSLELAGAAIIALLPDSPFNTLSNVDVSGYMGWLNWLVPIGQMVSVLELWGAAILIYYIYVTILRWIKAVQ
jgi:hypothetical protein